MKLRWAALILVLFGTPIWVTMSLVQSISERYLSGFSQRKWIAFSELMTDFHRLYGKLPEDIFAEAEKKGLIQESRGEVKLHFDPDQSFSLEYIPLVPDRWLFPGKTGQHLTIHWKAGDPELTVTSTLRMP